MPAMRRISEYSSSVRGQMVRRVFFRNLILRSSLFSRISASFTCRGSRSMARRSTTSFFSFGVVRIRIRVAAHLRQCVDRVFRLAVVTERAITFVREL